MFLGDEELKELKDFKASKKNKEDVEISLDEREVNALESIAESLIVLKNKIGRKLL